MEYPMINRELIDFTSDSDICNIGYAEGVLKDSRPFRAEMWSAYNVETLSIFISKIGLESKTYKEVLELLSNIVEIIDDKSDMNEITDINDNEFIVINIPINDHDEVVNKCLIKLQEFDV